MTADPTPVERRRSDVQRLTAALHASQAQGLLRRSEWVRQLFEGISDALVATVERNAGDPVFARAMQSDVYWDRFEMEIKEALLGAFSWVDPAVYDAVRDVVAATLLRLKQTYRAS